MDRRRDELWRWTVDGFQSRVPYPTLSKNPVPIPISGERYTQ